MIGENASELVFSLVKSGSLLDVQRLQRDAGLTKEDLNAVTDANGSSPLHYAAGLGYADLCQYMIDEWGIPVQAVCRKHGRTPLHWAARNGQTDVCILLVKEYEGDVDCEARGQVTPLQLACWQSHLITAKTLVDLGASPTFVNAWGCGVAHWIAMCPSYRENPESLIVQESLRMSCEWLFMECDIAFHLSNNHGQTPLHKAAFSGNLPVIKYLVSKKGIMDNVRDNQGNNAADCAERSQDFETAAWLRKYASPILHAALESMGFDCRIPPSVTVLRYSYLEKAKVSHPDRVRSDESRQAWDELHNAFWLLRTWWENPECYDSIIRLRSRNSLLLEHPRLMWNADWHASQKDQAIASLDKLEVSESEVTALLDFEVRLLKLLQNSEYRLEGLHLSKLPKEYKKNFQMALPVPRTYGCKKMIILIRRFCSRIDVRFVGPEMRIASLFPKT